MANVAPYGSWKSPLTAERVLQEAVSLAYPAVAGGDVYWLEGRPAEGGRVAILRRGVDGSTAEVLPARYSARTLVHEYGGLCYVVDGDTVYFSNFADQRLYRVEKDSLPEPITAEPPSPASVRYAAPVVSRDGRSLYCVRERHGTPGVATEVVNDIVLVPADGGHEPRVVAAGHDFFSFPTVAPDGRRLAWTSWDHPNMAWDGTELWEAELGGDGLAVGERLVAGGKSESVTQPRYSPDGRLHFISDRTGWWNIYVDDESGPRPLAPAAAEFAEPDWTFGQSTYCFIDGGVIAAVSSRAGFDVMSLLRAGSLSEVALPYTHLAGVVSRGDGVVAVAGSPLRATRIVSLDLPSGKLTTLKSAQKAVVDESYLSEPEPIDFPTEGSLVAHGLYYPPKNPDYVAPPGELPPLIVSSHGGPTSAAALSLNYGIQYWTSRGIAVVDVNYGGSSGYGREYRQRLRGQWGIVDLDDCVNAARYLATSGRVDGDCLLIHGGSAGGYTTLCALTFRNVFAGGASYFGVADAGALARHTHKFESRYLDGLIGPWPEAAAIYEQRSPVFHTELLRTPVILFQGLEDKIVPPAQSETLVQALRERGVPFAYLAYEGEQHGFRKAENIKATLEAELYFFGRVVGFEPSDKLPEVEIENAGALVHAGRGGRDGARG